ncbi:MAG: thioredoxin family protein [Phycisphaerales bacterium]|nr:thioredoxin family protein [Phycisphaerales bacterium]
MLTPAAYRAAFESALPYTKYLATAKPPERTRWEAFAIGVVLRPPQQALIQGFQRRINVLVISGTWCGDCVQQVPIFAAIAQLLPASDLGGHSAGIDLRMIDRDEHTDFSRHFTICGGGRVPVVIFLNEEFDFVALGGDRTLARYRRMAAAKLGPSCPLPGAPVPADEVAAVTADWLDQFERVALLLRLSTKLRAFHRD